MTAVAIVMVVAAAVAFLSLICTLLAMRKAYRLNVSARATYDAVYNTLEEAASLATDARTLVDGIAGGEHRDEDNWQAARRASAPDGWHPVTVAVENGLPNEDGPYLVGYGDDWQEFEEWPAAWEAHVIRGASRGSSWLLARDAEKVSS